LISYDFRSTHTVTAKGQSVGRVLLDYYKCPQELAEIGLKRELSDEHSFFQFGSGALCYGRRHSGLSVGRPGESLVDVSGAVEIENEGVRLPFDLTEVVDNLRRECYASPHHTSRPVRFLNAISRDIYYFLRPWMPISVRKHLQRLHLRGRQRLTFPQWPVDRTVDTIIEETLILCMKAKGVSSIPFIWFWPEGADSCVMMTHDVETSAGVDFCRELVALDESFGIRSSFQFVPEDRYVLSKELLTEIRGRGFEVGIQDLNHDGFLFRDREEFLRRAGRINEHLQKFGSKGFRSAIMYRNADWLEAIEASYDMSFPNVARFDPQQGGCCTIMPYFIGKILELPLTTIQDYSLFHILGDSSIGIWKQQIDLIRERNGLISFIVHPDYITPERDREIYKSLLSHLRSLRAESTLWMALPGEIDKWWRARDQMELVFRNGQWHVEGEGSERARTAYATVTDNRLTYSFHI
jgi:hypothetical protein